MRELTNKHFFEDQSLAYESMLEYKYPWEVIKNLDALILAIQNQLNPDFYTILDNNIYISKKAIVSPRAVIEGPCIIDDKANIGHFAIIRPNTIIGECSVIGNSSEIKNSIIFNYTKIPHFNYVGDSIISNHTNLGAGAILTNTRNDNNPIIIKHNGEAFHTGLNKLGAIIGSNVKIGANTVLNPGTIIFPKVMVNPNLSIKGIILKETIVTESNI